MVEHLAGAAGRQHHGALRAAVESAHLYAVAGTADVGRRASIGAVPDARASGISTKGSNAFERARDRVSRRRSRVGRAGKKRTWGEIIDPSVRAAAHEQAVEKCHA